MPESLPLRLHCQIPQITARNLWLTIILIKKFYFSDIGVSLGLFSCPKDGLANCSTGKKKKKEKSMNGRWIQIPVKHKASFNLFSITHIQNWLYLPKKKIRLMWFMRGIDTNRFKNNVFSMTWNFSTMTLRVKSTPPHPHPQQGKRENALIWRNYASGCIFWNVLIRLPLYYCFLF